MSPRTLAGADPRLSGQEGEDERKRNDLPCSWRLPLVPHGYRFSARQSEVVLSPITGSPGPRSLCLGRWKPSGSRPLFAASIALFQLFQEIVVCRLHGSG